jgi:hypothetical protein
MDYHYLRYLTGIDNKYYISEKIIKLSENELKEVKTKDVVKNCKINKIKPLTAKLGNTFICFYYYRFQNKFFLFVDLIMDTYNYLI